MLDAAYEAAVREEALCRALLEQLHGELTSTGPRHEEFRRLHAQAEAGWLEAKRRVEKFTGVYEKRFSDSR